MTEKQSANNNRTYIVNQDSEQLPELINERQLEDIKHVLETPLDSDEDLIELGRESDE